VDEDVVVALASIVIRPSLYDVLHGSNEVRLQPIHPLIDLRA
jgi:hypothetical protein